MISLPATMRVIVITGPGNAGVLAMEEQPIPQPGPGEVLIQVAAAGVNRPDILQRQGLYPPPPGASDIPGLEVAGWVVALGEGVTTPAIGQPVCALVTGGGYADYCLAAAPLCLPVPQNLTCTQAAALPEALFTVWLNVVTRGKLKTGETLLVQGGSSGIGTTAIQLAKQLGARVLATAGNEDKCAVCRQLGAETINYRDGDFKDRVLDLTGGEGVDLILDIVGGPYLSRHLEILAPEGRLVIIALQGGPKTEVNLLPIMLKRLTVTGSTLRPRSLAEKTALARTLRDKVWPLLETGRIRPLIHQTFPLEAVRAAHELMESSCHTGKIILTMAPS
jgi:putative PIG3 family NAD(P)H quinone oxidoreductase